MGLSPLETTSAPAGREEAGCLPPTQPRPPAPRPVDRRRARPTGRPVVPTGKGKCCCHPERARFELLLATGVSMSAVARRFRLNVYAVNRHWHFHISESRRAALAIGPAEVQALKARVAEESESVIDHYRALRSAMYDFLIAAQEAGDRNGGALIVGRLIEINNAIAKVTGQLANSPLIQHNTVNLLNMASGPVSAADAERAYLSIISNPHADLSGLRFAAEKPALEHEPINAIPIPSQETNHVGT
jgi:hypothetical protein